MEISTESLYPYLLFNKEIQYNDKITLYPIRMKDIVPFQKYQNTITLRKDSIFSDKEIIKMSYLEFLKFSCRNFELAERYNIDLLPLYYDMLLQLLQLACGQEAKISYNESNLNIAINDVLITDEMFDDLRRIIIIQNDIDFDIDEFMNIDTVKALEKARAFEAKKSNEKHSIEDYIDSLVVSLRISEDYISQLTIRKFWRYIRRIQKHEDYQSCYTAQLSGLVTFKEPLEHWMTSFDVKDKYENLKADEDEIRSKIG